MYKILFAILFFPLLANAQLQPLGAVLGNQTVIPIPTYPAGYAISAQALVYYPDDYFLPANANKRYPLYLFLHGAGEGSKADISELLNTSLPQLIAQGLKPYGIDTLTGDTIRFIVVSPHCAGCGGSYSYPQLQYTLPYLISNYRIDTTCMWVGGLSSGGRGTFSMPMGNIVGDTVWGKKLAGIMPMANGGYDDRTDLFPNLVTAMKSGMAVLYTIGDQDAGYNTNGFLRYDSLMRKNTAAGKYYSKVIVGGTHSATVWTPPFYLTSRIWNAKYNAWTQMANTRRPKAAVVNPVKARIWIDSALLHYPNNVANLADSSTGNSWTTWGCYAYPTGYPGVWGGQCNFKSMLLAGLLPGGAYGVQLVVGDANGHTDTARAQISVSGPPKCPVCPVCPAPRTAIVTWTIINGLPAPIITYSDGNP